MTLEVSKAERLSSERSEWLESDSTLRAKLKQLQACGLLIDCASNTTS